MENVVGVPLLGRLELSCLRKCAEGKSDVEIGIEHEMTSSEVASLLTVVRMKLKCPNRLSAIAKAARLGLIMA